MFTLLIPLRAQGYEIRFLQQTQQQCRIYGKCPLGATGRLHQPAWIYLWSWVQHQQHNSVPGEIMWNGLSPTSEALAPIRAALQNNYINGHGIVAALTANYNVAI